MSAATRVSRTLSADANQGKRKSIRVLSKLRPSLSASVVGDETSESIRALTDRYATTRTQTVSTSLPRMKARYRPVESDGDAPEPWSSAAPRPGHVPRVWRARIIPPRSRRSPDAHIVPTTIAEGGGDVQPHTEVGVEHATTTPKVSETRSGVRIEGPSGPANENSTASKTSNSCGRESLLLAAANLPMTIYRTKVR